jgi:drug/metabolite transporter (DMT)-like permease
MYSSLQTGEQQVPLYTVETDAVEKPKATKSLWNRCHEHSGIWYMLTANIIFACCTFALKLIPADMFDIMIIRFLIQSVVFGSFAAFYKRYNVFDTNGQPFACAMNVLMSSGTNLTYLAAFYFLPLSDLNTIKYTYIVWAAILSVIFLKDRFKVVNGISLMLTVIGLLLATKPHFLMKILSHIFDESIIFSTNTTNTNVSSAAVTSQYYYIGVVFAFISSLTKAIQMIARKKLVATKQPYSVMNFQFTSVALIVVILYSIIRRFWQPSPYPWKWMFTVGVVIGCFQLITNTFYAKALKRENVQLLSILGTMDILYACVLQYIFLRLTKSWIFYIGASFIVISAIILSIDSHLMHKKQRQEQVANENKKTNI